MRREVCERCGWNYPDDVSKNRVIGSMVEHEVCGICALQIVNAIHGSHSKSFTEGSRAEDARQEAVKARFSGAAFPPA